MDLLQVRTLSIEFQVPSGAVKAGDGASFRIKEASTVRFRKINYRSSYSGHTSQRCQYN